MGRNYASVMFGEAARRLQAEHGSRASYERFAEHGPSDSGLAEPEIEFIGQSDSFYLASVTPDLWPYVQHRGGPKGFLKVLDSRTLIFADFERNKQYISVGNLESNDRIALFLMDYPNQARLKIIGHASVLSAAAESSLLRILTPTGVTGQFERIVRIDVAGFDWNCSLHITPRYTREQIEAAFGAGQPGV